MPPKIGFYYISNIFLAALCSFTTLLITIITVKAIRLVRDSDPVIPAMLIFLDLSLIGSMLFFSWSNYRVFANPWPDEYGTQAVCEKTVLPFVPVISLTCAVILNVNKWIYCLMHIKFYSIGS